MRDIDRYFFGLGTFAALCGMVMGIGMGIAHDFSIEPVHAHVNLVGWASFALFGLGYRTGFAKSDGWAVAHFWVATAGLLIFPTGIYVAVRTENPALAILGALLTLASMLLFFINFLRARRA